MNSLLVRIEVFVNPTEDLDKVKQAVNNMFGTLEFNIKPGTDGCVYISENRGYETLIRFHDLLNREMILAAARKILRNEMTEESVIFYLNKQVAFAGHVSFSQQTSESPLGPIKVQIYCDNPKKFIDWLAPRPPPKTRKKSLHRN
ncbi:MAG: RNA-binding domain-containing protein [Candidatus Bathyarchaeota archaeon]